MYYCTTCKVAHKNKPYYSNNCDYCGAKTIKKLNPKINHVIKDIDLDVSYNELTTEFNSFNNFTLNSGYNYRTFNGRELLYHGLTNLNINLNMRPLGYILDNIEQFTTLSYGELTLLYTKLFGKTQNNIMVKIKLDDDDYYRMIPISFIDIISWFKNNDLNFKFKYYKTWALCSIAEDTTIDEIYNNLVTNARQLNDDGYNSRYYSSYLYFIS